MTKRNTGKFRGLVSSFEFWTLEHSFEFRISSFEFGLKKEHPQEPFLGVREGVARLGGTGVGPDGYCTIMTEAWETVTLKPPSLLLHSWPSMVPRNMRVAPGGTMMVFCLPVLVRPLPM